MRCWIAIAVVVAAEFALAGDETGLDDSDRRAFAWFDGIGLPSCASRPLVRVTQSRKDPKDDGGPWVTDGFLLSETESAWTLLRTDLWTERIERHAEWLNASLERLDLK